MPNISLRTTRDKNERRFGAIGDCVEGDSLMSVGRSRTRPRLVSWVKLKIDPARYPAKVNLRKSLRGGFARWTADSIGEIN
jgi:hypothetical protein